MSSEKHNNAKTVRFATNVAAAAPPRRQRDEDDDDNHDSGPHKKRPRLERPNEDEQDDVDDWEEKDIGEDDDEGVLKAKELLDLKRKRRERQHHAEDLDEEGDDTHIDSRTSLLSEKNDDADNEIAIDPFNMDAEQNDGSGFFDGDTYVFRKREAEEEPDAWLESLSDNKQVASIPERMDAEEEEEGTSMDDLSKDDLMAKIVPLVSDNNESVLQAVARYGNLLKRQKKNNKASNEATVDASVQTAQKALNDLTEAANALMLKGHVDIYQQTRTELMKLLPDSKPPATKEQKQIVRWEYRGNQDGQIHGPYTTEQMLSWIQAGYFIGEQAVQIRTIAKESPENKSTADDLLSDLMDDEDEQQEKEVKGEWTSSNDVDFTLYG